MTLNISEINELSNFELYSKGAKIFSRILGATSNFLAPELLHAASSTLGTQNHQAPPYKLELPG